MRGGLKEIWPLLRWHVYVLASCAIVAFTLTGLHVEPAWLRVVACLVAALWVGRNAGEPEDPRLRG